MSAKKQKYRRLQVNNIALRTLFEVAALILAIVISCSVVISSYETSYAESAVGDAEQNARQLAYSISGMADFEAMATENIERREYVVDLYSEMLDGCFIEEDVRYSGAIYSVGETEVILFSASSSFGEMLKNFEENEDAENTLTEAMEKAAAGEQTAVKIGDCFIAFQPVNDSRTGKVYALSAAAVDYRASTEFDSPVKSRLVLISVVSGILILAYFMISSARSEKKKLRGEAV